MFSIKNTWSAKAVSGVAAFALVASMFVALVPSAVSAEVDPTPPTIPGSTECSDLVDNDEDGLKDFFPLDLTEGWGDPDCESLFDDSEGPSVPPSGPACSGDMGELLVDVTQAVSNNPDSGFHGNWATDTFTKHMRIWAEDDYYCGQTDDEGTFVTTGPNSPGFDGEPDLPLDAGIEGTFSGGARYVIDGGTPIESPEWPTSGAVPPKDDGAGGGYSLWIAEYFDGATYDFYYWGWTYDACGHGTWTNSDTVNEGDIVTEGEDCAAETPDDTDTDGDNEESSGGGGGGGKPSIAGTPSSVSWKGGGEVLGTTTLACDPLLMTYLGMGKGNSADEVLKLQTFLNEELGLELATTSIFDEATKAAVEQFQLKYADQVLAPWLPFGLASTETPTGYVYKTTQRMINMISCATLEIPMPQLP